MILPLLGSNHFDALGCEVQNCSKNEQKCDESETDKKSLYLRRGRSLLIFIILLRKLTFIQKMNKNVTKVRFAKID